MLSITKNLLSYNTSFVNDCHNNQLHPGLSESASLMQKAIEEYRDKGKGEATYEKLVEQTDFGESLENLRRAYDTRNTKYIKEKLDKKNMDFVSLIEQTIHVGKNNADYEHCYYVQETLPSTNLDLEYKYDKTGSIVEPTNIKNEDYGFLKKLKAFENVLNISDETKDIDVNDKYKYFCVFDTVMTIPPKEGISMIFNKNLIDPGKILTWRNTDVPNRRKNIDKGRLRKSDGKAQNLESKVRFYSSDMGPPLCYSDYDYEEMTGTVLQYKAPNGGTDAGRPLIIAGGIKEDTLVLFVAFHSPNFLNLSKKQEDGNYVNLLDPINRDSLEEDYKTLIVKFKTSFVGELDRAISKSGVEDNAYRHIDMYIGCDSNDAKGHFLYELVFNSLKIKGKTIRFSMKRETKQAIKDCGSKIPQPPGSKKMDDVCDPFLACCANSDSQWNPTTNIEKTGPLNKDLFDRVKDKEKYKENFQKYGNFGYLGDYVLYGSSDQTVSAAYNNDMKKDVTILGDNTNIPSDHLPIIQERPNKPVTTGGKRRTRRRGRRSTRRKKKLSRRKRHTRKRSRKHKK